MVKFIEYKGFDHVWKYWGTWTWYLIGVYLSLPVLVYIVLPYFTSNYNVKRPRKRIIIMVLGDLGHSPRMCYHAKSLSELSYDVDLCGYLETHPPNDIIDDVNISINELPLIKNHGDLPFIVFAPYKIFLQCFSLFGKLWELRGAAYIMIQNPPSLPLLFLIVVFLKLVNRKTKLVIDWHNLNYTILNLKFNNLSHPLVRFLRAYEKYLGGYASLNITVTDNMKTFLKSEFNIKNEIITLHDRPAMQFKPTTVSERTALLSTHELFSDISKISSYKILVSSTSFTEDEDFSILLDALKKYEHNLSQKRDLPPLLLVVTGKGPLKQQFLTSVEKCQFKPSEIIVKTAWLKSEDYPKILAVADIGISLHTSSSGIDLPMKIVDMFGCGIPVITLNFKTIHELVLDGKNGFVVEEAGQMCDKIAELAVDQSVYEKVKGGALTESDRRWDDEWDSCLSKYFRY